MIMNIFARKKQTSVKLPHRRKTVGVAFGGGGLKGSAHVGVLQVLAEYGIPIDYVAGTSIGSAVAALYASGYDWRKLDILFNEYDIQSLLKVRPNRKGLIPAEGYTELIRTCTKGRQIQEMDVPLKIVAVDLLSRKKIVFSSGDTATAVRASSSLPGVFTPVHMGDMLLVDGYILDNCPGDVVRNMGADVVIAISLHVCDTSEPTNILGIVNRSLDIAAHSFQEIDADIVLSPIDEPMGTLDTQNIAVCRELGEKCAREHIDEILKLIGR